MDNMRKLENGQEFETAWTDVVIVGTGVAGLYCAAGIRENLKVIMITKDTIKNSDSYLAQGGICTLKDKSDYKSFFEDTMKAGRYKNNPKAVDVMIKSSHRVIENLSVYGVDFDRTENGLSYTREGAHSANRILHHKDATGKEIVEKLIEQVKKKENVEIYENTTMLDIIEYGDSCKGIIVSSEDNGKAKVRVMFASAIVWACGGIGGLFESSTNFSHLTGDALAISLKHGIELQDINYIQIHPTTLYSKRPGRRFLISESVRGEGGYLMNPAGERFADELLPRDVLTSAICREMERFHTDYVYLSVTHLGEGIKERFPTIYKKCLEEGYDLIKDKVPVTPAQHYFMGGVKVNLNSRTSMKGLYAIGETSCNGVHGANRLASNSLLESLVFGQRAAKDISLHVSAFDQNKDLVKTSIRYLKTHGLELENKRKWEEENKKIILDEIKRKDKKFYDKWCIHAG